MGAWVSSSKSWASLAAPGASPGVPGGSGGSAGGHLGASGRLLRAPWGRQGVAEGVAGPPEVTRGGTRGGRRSSRWVETGGILGAWRRGKGRKPPQELGLESISI